jgi:dipeptidyl aminopeptidase/acylaminoacyl peptidase
MSDPEKPIFQLGEDGELPDELAAQFVDDTYIEKPKDKPKVTGNPFWSCREMTIAGVLLVIVLLILPILNLFTAPNKQPVVYYTPVPTVPPTPGGILDEMPTCFEEPMPQAGFIVIAVALYNTDSELVRTDLDGDNACRLTVNDVNDADPAISADGQYIYFGTEPDAYRQAIMRIRADGTQVEQIRAFGADPAISPDGATVILSSALVYGSDIYSAQVGGSSGADFSLTSDDVYATSNDISADWSPDGTQLVYVSDRYGDKTQGAKLNLFIMDKDGMHPHRVFESDGLHLSPNWSPDGARIVFAMLGEDNWSTEIYTVRPDGTELKQWTTDGTMKYSPVWGRDNDIYYIALPPDTIVGAVFRINADGEITQITDALHAKSLDVWQPQDD